MKQSIKREFIYIYNSVAEKASPSLTQRQKQGQAYRFKHQRGLSTRRLQQQSLEELQQSLRRTPSPFLPVFPILVLPPPAHSAIQVSTLWVTPDSSPSFFTPPLKITTTWSPLLCLELHSSILSSLALTAGLVLPPWYQCRGHQWASLLPVMATPAQSFGKPRQTTSIAWTFHFYKCLNSEQN